MEKYEGSSRTVAHGRADALLDQSNSSSALVTDVARRGSRLRAMALPRYVRVIFLTESIRTEQ
jgi:hypothetical protein